MIIIRIIDITRSIHTYAMYRERLHNHWKLIKQQLNLLSEITRYQFIPKIVNSISGSFHYQKQTSMNNLDSNNGLLQIFQMSEFVRQTFKFKSCPTTADISRSSSVIPSISFKTKNFLHELNPILTRYCQHNNRKFLSSKQTSVKILDSNN